MRTEVHTVQGQSSWSSFLTWILTMLGIWLTSSTSGRAESDAELTKFLKGLDKQVTSAHAANTNAKSLPDIQERLLQQANDASSSEWNKITSKQKWQDFRSAKLEPLLKSLTHDLLLGKGDRSSPLRVTSTFEGEGFTIENLVYEIQQGCWGSANLYRPSPPRPSMPGIIISHSHHTSKEHGELQDMGMTWARAGCLVLIPDHMGHGERRQHPFASAADFDKKFRVGPADYYFRYDNAMQLELVDECLIGWMARDLSYGADILFRQKRFDPKRLIVLGAVAGGGDPAALAGLLDSRFTAIVPFNFGGPQPETKYPLPMDIETSFNYAGSGSWESTRNLRQSASDGFLPWVIVGSIAPRRLIYAHEFSWDQEHDPVWKRLQKIYKLQGASHALDYTHGFGELKGQPPEASHCTHIGKPHRVRIHQAFEKWFGIKVTPETEYSNRLPAEKLHCWTAKLREELKPLPLANVVSTITEFQLEILRSNQPELPLERRSKMLERWNRILAPAPSATTIQSTTEKPIGEHNLTKVSYVSHCLDEDEWTMSILLTPDQISLTEPIVLALCSQGVTQLLAQRPEKIAAYLEKGSAVCLLDPIGIGESRLGKSHGRRSDVTAYSSTELMLGSPIIRRQLRHVITTMDELQSRPEFQGRSIHIWADSLLPPNPNSAPFHQPRDDDSALPAPSEPQAALLALLAGLYHNDVVSIDAAGCVASWQLLLKDYLVLMSYQSLIPGVLTTGDICDLVGAQRPETKVILRRSVDGLNRLVPKNEMKRLFAKQLERTPREPVRLEISDE